jgi:hypothetical protein
MVGQGRVRQGQVQQPLRRGGISCYGICCCWPSRQPANALPSYTRTPSTSNAPCPHTHTHSPPAVHEYTWDHAKFKSGCALHEGAGARTHWRAALRHAPVAVVRVLQRTAPHPMPPHPKPAALSPHSRCSHDGCTLCPTCHLTRVGRRCRAAREGVWGGRECSTRGRHQAVGSTVQKKKKKPSHALLGERTCHTQTRYEGHH